MPSDESTAEDKRCRDCGICHHEHPDANKSGGMGRILPWREGRCPACADRRRERSRKAARRYVFSVLDPDDSYCEPTPQGQATLEEVLG